MMKLKSKMAGLLLAVLVLSLASCSDELSEIGGSIQPGVDQVAGKVRNLQFEASTITSNATYSGGTTFSLLGGIADPAYGDFKADFITQLRTARGFSFSQSPIDGQVDSVRLFLTYTRSVGSQKAPLALEVYEVEAGYTGSDYSTEDLSSYAQPSRLLGSQLLNLEANSHLLIRNNSLADSTSGVRFVSLPLAKELGQRFYDKSRTSPEVFATQEDFAHNVLAGLYITATTRGAVLAVGSVELRIYYSYLDDKGERKVSSEAFINTALTPHTNALANSSSSGLIQNSSDFTYVKGPAGVLTEVRLARGQMVRLLEGVDQVQIGREWTLSDAPLKLKVNNPSDLLLNPPTYMMLLPQDSVAPFFEKGQTERTAVATSYLSTPYSVDSPQYDFLSISRLITEHLRRHASYDATTKRWSVASDLVMHLLPVERSVTQSGEQVVTTKIDEYLFPSFVRLSRKAEDLRIGVVSAEFKR